MTPFVGQVVQYRYKPESSAAPLAAIVTVVHDKGGDGKDWVALYVFSEVPRLLPHVEYAIHCREAIAPITLNPYEGIFP
jgi:hypothetical protein